MKRIILFLFSLVCFAMNAQTMRHFECDLFSFNYPSSYKPAPINDAPHMVLKIANADKTFSISCWDYGIDDDVSVWDDDIVDYYCQMSDPNMEHVKIQRALVHTRSGNQRCLRIKSNIHDYYNGYVLKVKLLQYIMIYDGYLLVFQLGSDGAYTKDSPTTEGDNLMRGLKFKNFNTSQIDVDFKSHLLNSIKTLNAQCPLKIDACTTYLQVLLSGKKIMIKTLVPYDCDDYADYEEFKDIMIMNFSKSLENSFVLYLDNEGYSINYLIYNESNELKKTIVIKPKDILDFY